MTTSTLLSADELILINNARATKAKEAAELAALAVTKAEAEAKRKAADIELRGLLQSANLKTMNVLKDADVDGLITWESKVHPDTNVNELVATFMFNGNKNTIHLHDGRYELCGSATAYKTRRYVKVATLLARIAEFNASDVAHAKRKIVSAEREVLALEQLAVMSPSGAIEVKAPSAYVSRSHKYYTTYHVTTTLGTVVYTSAGFKEGKHSFTVVGTYPSKSVQAELVKTMIAG